MANNEERKPIKVVGEVEFYGKVDTYNKREGKLKEGDPEKEYCLTLKNYKFKDLDPEEVKKWYTDDKGKTKLPGMWDDILNGKEPELLYFKSNYPVESFQIVVDGNIVETKIDYSPDLKGRKVSMTCYKQYIGAIAIKELPPEYKRIAFEASEFDDL